MRMLLLCLCLSICAAADPVPVESLTLKHIQSFNIGVGGEIEIYECDKVKDSFGQTIETAINRRVIKESDNAALFAALRAAITNTKQPYIDAKKAEVAAQVPK